MVAAVVVQHLQARWHRSNSDPQSRSTLKDTGRVAAMVQEVSAVSRRVRPGRRGSR